MGFDAPKPPAPPKVPAPSPVQDALDPDALARNQAALAKGRVNRNSLRIDHADPGINTSGGGGASGNGLSLY